MRVLSTSSCDDAAAQRHNQDTEISAGELRVTREPWLGGHVLSYPDRPRTVVDVLDGAVRVRGHREAFVDGERRVTTAEFAALVEGAVATLRAEGFEPGDRLGVALDNGLELAVALFACARGGFILVGLNTRLQPPQWAYMMAHARVRMALAAPAHLDDLRVAGRDAGLAEPAVRAVGGLLTGSSQPWSYDRSQQPAEYATFAVVYTSGSTGRPKASQVVHRASVHSSLSYVHTLGLGSGDRTAVLFPLYYISGLHAHVLPMLLTGGTSVLVADSAPARYVELLARERVTWMYAVPAFWQMLLRHDAFRSPELDHVRLGASGGAPFPRDRLPELRRRLPQLRMHDIYGLSETHSPATMLLPGEFDEKPGSVGRPLPCMEARVVVDGAAHETDEPGDLELRGSLVTTGYLEDDVATAAAIGPDGWFKTGDVARIDADGFVWILDRVKDMINRGGHKIFSVEVEQLLREHPAIADAAVVAVPDRVAHEAVACYVVPVSGEELSVREVRRWVAERMATYASPRLVRVIDELPRNPTGKTDKPLLRERLLDERPELRKLADDRAGG